MDISYMALTNSVVESVLDVCVVVDVEDSTSPTTGIGIVVSGTIANCDKDSFPLSIFSSSTSISLIQTFYSIITLNMCSFFFPNSPISLVCRSSVDGSLSCYITILLL